MFYVHVRMTIPEPPAPPETLVGVPPFPPPPPPVLGVPSIEVPPLAAFPPPP